MLTEVLGWVLRTVTTAAEAQMNADPALREQLLEAEMRREMGDITDEEFKTVEADLLARIREIRARREGGAGPLTMGTQPIETSPDSRFEVEASVTGDFYDPADAPHTTVVESAPGFTEQIAVMDMEPGQADPRPEAALPLSSSRPAAARRARTARTARTGSSKLRSS